MLNAKILAAVFISLAAISFGMNGGSLESSKIQDISLGSDSPVAGLMPNSLGAFSKYLDKPEPQTEIHAALNVKSLKGHSVELEAEEVETGNLTQVRVGDYEFNTDQNIIFTDFSGKLSFNKLASLQGESNGLKAGNTSFSGSVKVSEEFSASTIRVESVDRSEVVLDSVSGSLRSNSSSAELQNARLNINSFTGDLIYFVSNSSVVIDGSVDRLNAGEISFGN